MDLLGEELKSLDDFGFDITITGFDLAAEQDLVDDGYEPELPKVAKSKLGQIYQHGRHRLVCGDSTKTGHVAQLMNGAHAVLM